MIEACDKRTGKCVGMQQTLNACWLLLIKTKTLKPSSDPPSGAPVVNPSEQWKHANQDVALKCDITPPAENGNPACNEYHWNRTQNGISEEISWTQKEYFFKMEENIAANYTCQCSNMYGSSGISGTSEVFFLTGPAPEPSPSGPCRCHFFLS